MGRMGRREYINWVDTGCDLCPSCLACPLPRCRYDMPPKRAGSLLRMVRVLDLLAQGLTVGEVAAAMGISQRSVFRLKQQRQDGGGAAE